MVYELNLVNHKIDTNETEFPKLRCTFWLYLADYMRHHLFAFFQQNGAAEYTLTSISPLIIKCFSYSLMKWMNL